VGRTFTQTWDEREQRKLQTRVRTLLVNHGMSRKEVQEKLNASNTSGDGVLRIGGLTAFFQSVAPAALTSNDISSLYQSLKGQDAGAVVMIDDFLNALFPDTRLRRRTTRISFDDGSCRNTDGMSALMAMSAGGGGLTPEQLSQITGSTKETTQQVKNLEKRIDGMQDNFGFRLKNVEQRMDRVADTLGDLVSLLKKLEGGGTPANRGSSRASQRRTISEQKHGSWNPFSMMSVQEEVDGNPSYQSATPSNLQA